MKWINFIIFLCCLYHYRIHISMTILAMCGKFIKWSQYLKNTYTCVLKREIAKMNVSVSHEFLPNRPSTLSCIFAAFCCITFTVVGCVGNWLTIVALTRCRRLRNATTAFVVSLAVADFLFCAVCLPLTATRYIYEEWILGNELCNLFPFFFYGNVAASLMSMTAITFNRYVLF